MIRIYIPVLTRDGLMRSDHQIPFGFCFFDDHKDLTIIKNIDTMITEKKTTVFLIRKDNSIKYEYYPTINEFVDGFSPGDDITYWKKTSYVSKLVKLPIIQKIRDLNFDLKEDFEYRGYIRQDFEDEEFDDD